MTINVGPQHPATHGVFRMVLTVDGEMVVDCEPYIGYLHRGLEKLSENNDYRQAMGCWDRTDYLAGMCLRDGLLHGRREARRHRRSPSAPSTSASCMCGALADQLALHVPRRVRRRRRLVRHVASSTPGASASASTTSSKKSRATACSRRTSVPAASRWTSRTTSSRACRQLLGSIQQGLEDLDGLLTGNEIFVERCRDLAPDDDGAGDQARASRGPMLRATGLALGHPQGRALQRLRPPQVRHPRRHGRATSSTATSSALTETYQSIQDRRAVPGPDARRPRPQPGPAEDPPHRRRRMRTSAYEGTKGEYGVYAMARGGNKPYRMKLRSPVVLQPLGPQGDGRRPRTWRTRSSSSGRSISCSVRWTSDGFGDPFFGYSWLDAIIRVVIVVLVMTVFVMYLDVRRAQGGGALPAAPRPDAHWPLRAPPGRRGLA